MIAFPAMARSLRARLIVAFLAVAAVPMLVAVWLSAGVVGDAFEDNIRQWLTETSSFFMRVIEERRNDAEEAAQFLRVDTSLAERLLAGGELSQHDRALLDAAGLDVLALVDGSGRVAYSSKPISGLHALDSVGGAGLYRASFGGRDIDMIGGDLPIEIKGASYRLIYGVWLDEDFIGKSEIVTSLTIRLYIRSNGGFRRIYSSHGASDTIAELPPSVVQKLGAGNAHVFRHESEPEDLRALYTPLRAPDGSLRGVLLCALAGGGSWNGLITRTSLFLVVLGLGTLLSAVAALWLSRRLLGPLRSLSEGVHAIGAGDFGRTVRVERDDELGELATHFNTMSTQLARLRELETQLRRQERLGALGEMALGFAHEVRNPLGIIQTSAQLIAREAALPERAEKLLGYVVDEVRRIEALIAEFMDFANPAEAELRDVVPSAVIERVTSFAAPEFAARGIACDVVNEAADGHVLGDERLIHQALLNLVLNAIEATPDGGRVAIHARYAGSWLEIDVVDSGPGVPPDARERIFNPFFTTKTRGTGLGLAIVHAAMERHAGSVEYRDAPGGGACFRLRFPVSPLVTPSDEPPD